MMPRHSDVRGTSDVRHTITDDASYTSADDEPNSEPRRRRQRRLLLRWHSGLLCVRYTSQLLWSLRSAELLALPSKAATTAIFERQQRYSSNT